MARLQPARFALALAALATCLRAASACDCTSTCGYGAGHWGRWCYTGTCGTFVDGGWFSDDSYWLSCTPCDDSCASCTQTAGSSRQQCASCPTGSYLSYGSCYQNVNYGGCSCSGSCGPSYGVIGPSVSGNWCKTSGNCGIYYDGVGYDNYWCVRRQQATGQHARSGHGQRQPAARASAGERSARSAARCALLPELTVRRARRTQV
jgi:hypothetical protein